MHYQNEFQWINLFRSIVDNLFISSAIRFQFYGDFYPPTSFVILATLLLPQRRYLKPTPEK